MRKGIQIRENIENRSSSLKWKIDFKEKMKSTSINMKSKTRIGGVLPLTLNSPSEPIKIEKIKRFKSKNGDSKE